ncbi:B3 domain-containing protein Os06g0194400-like [Lolium rigidum]|uniref:B3 domain-containing protein Os06g0194400-like n=1 Tax=Lolium rigidum TaxID=89674 RepID=UPI001F5D38FE|nr:B3 domain-containing protein Os06g0194400-like [Lolium rigidum]
MEMAYEEAISMREELRRISGDPIFVKPMMQSNVIGGFWLGLPAEFCQQNLPRHDTTITLVDEAEAGTAAFYRADKTGISAGWRRFVLEHGLVQGDCLVFQLIHPATLKVYIVRKH